MILDDVRVISRDGRVIFHVALNVYCSMSCLSFGLEEWAQRRINHCEFGQGLVGYRKRAQRGIKGCMSTLLSPSFFTQPPVS